MTRRKAIGKKTRFEVFKRDSFKCQYCGKTAPDVILNVDHISPVSKGGDNDIMNLITACFDCNSGKSDIELSDDSMINKQRQQLEELSERRDQLEMMLKWRDGLKEIDDLSLNAIKDAWEDSTPGYFLNETGIKLFKNLLKKFSVNEILDAIELAADQYLEEDDDGDLEEDSVEKAMRKIGGIARIRKQPKYMQELFYIRGILRNRLHYCNDYKAIDYLKSAYEAGMEIEKLKDISRSVRNWTEFEDEILSIIEGQ